MLLIYQRDNRPILITPGYATIICHCQADQACANQALGLTQPNRQPIDYSSYLSHCMRRDTGGNRANGRGPQSHIVYISNDRGICLRGNTGSISSYTPACLKQRG